LVPILCRNNIVHTTPSFLLKIHFNIVACRRDARQQTRNKRGNQSLLGSHQRSNRLAEISTTVSSYSPEHNMASNILRPKLLCIVN
jgi:hypothetical protein